MAVPQEKRTAKKTGRPTRLTPEVGATVLDAVREGYGITSAARLAGLPWSTLKFWLWGADSGRLGGQFATFSTKVRAAQREAAKAVIRANPRPLARARYEHDASPEELRDLFFREVMRCQKEGRVPFDVARDAFQMAADTCEDRLVAESVGFAENFALARTHGGSRGVSQ